MNFTLGLYHGEDQCCPASKKRRQLSRQSPEAPCGEDHRSEMLWFQEPSQTAMVITESGVENIVHHKYVSGKYTNLEKFLNPTWEMLTECYVPMWMAPNLITTIGLCFELISYSVTWYFSDDVPSWVCLLNGMCLLFYYTLDCMDGKQARRTNSASPLGQLFDHGIDCLCTIAHVSTMGACFRLGGSYWYILAQVTLQLSFFMSQWEEYHTGVLEHIGVTEVMHVLFEYAVTYC